MGTSSQLRGLFADNGTYLIGDGANGGHVLGYLNQGHQLVEIDGQLGSHVIDSGVTKLVATGANTVYYTKANGNLRQFKLNVGYNPLGISTDFESRNNSVPYGIPTAVFTDTYGPLWTDSYDRNAVISTGSSLASYGVGIDGLDGIDSTGELYIYRQKKWSAEPTNLRFTAIAVAMGGYQKSGFDFDLDWLLDFNG